MPADIQRRHLLRASLAGTAWATALAQAQSLPRNLRIVVPFTPGGSTDILARALAPKLAAALGATVVVDNRPGAGGSVGAAEAARAEPDGATLLMGHIGTLAVNPALYPKLAYDPLKSFTPVAYVARVPNVLVVPAASAHTTFQQLLDAARARPGRLSYSSGGNGSAAHISFEFLKLRTGSPAVLQHIRSGRLRALAVSSARRIAALPEVPSVAESGYPGFEADQWYGLVAPAGTPAALVARLNAETNRALALPDVAEQLAREGALAVPATPQAFGEHIRRELPRWAEVVKAGNVKPD